jgi:hypothetical protein
VSQVQVFASFTRAGVTTQRRVNVTEAVIAGWTGRDPEAVEKHIRELQDLGVARPASVPIFYRVAATRLTTAPSIEVSGEDSSGEVEFVLLQSEGTLWLGLGSDHTDRKVETYNVTASKQMCDKPIASQFWAFDEVADHFDQLALRSFIDEKGERLTYQDGKVRAMRTPADLIHRYTQSESLSEGTLMFCGTLAARGGIRGAPRFHMELEDPILGRRITHSYAVTTLPVMG